MADKLLITTALILLLHLQLVAVWMVVVLIARELLINTLKSIANLQGIQLSSSLAGKSKTVAQAYAIGFTLIGPLALINHPKWTWGHLGLFAFYISIFLSLYSAGLYFYIFLQKIKKSQS